MKPKMRTIALIITILLSIALTGCATLFSTVVVDSVPKSIDEAIRVIPTQTIKPTPTPNPFSLAGLEARTYGNGELSIDYTWEEKEEFIRYKIIYDSDNLSIHGFVNIPTGNGPFPVVVTLHGYIPASEYETLDYSTRYADSIARKGYIVLHPNLRNFPPSDSISWKRDYQSGFVIDVINLLAHVRELAGQPGIFENADLSRIGVWGHSLGGGTALRLVGLIDEIQAAVLYGAVSQRYTNENTGIEILDYENTNASFSVHHGVLDNTISVAWSQRLCAQLKDAGKEPECFFYEDQPHTFYRLGDGDALFIKRTIEFFDRNLKDT